MAKRSICPSTAGALQRPNSDQIPLKCQPWCVGMSGFHNSERMIVPEAVAA